tara:strand:+ start:958 stop:1476 length:519 start_codon:yes stop_codon:yes gene_type:complete
MDDFEIEIFEDDGWISKLCEKELELEKFYKKDITFITLNVIFIDCCKNIIKVKKKKIKINDNLLSKKRIFKIINQHKEFKLFSIGKYNFNIDIENINSYNQNNDEFFESIQSIKDIYWSKTIPIFERLNSIYLFFIEKSKNKTMKNHIKKNKQTKKLRIKEMITNDEIINLN